MKKKIVIGSIVVVLFVLFFPFQRETFKDGGTRILKSLTYEMIVWHEMNDDYAGGYKTGTEVTWFPYFKKLKC